jgi:flagellar biosynthesis protein FlhG
MLLDEIQELTKTYDYVLIDTGAGISNAVLQLNSCSHDIVVVSNPEPHALTDAYAFIKVMNQVYGKNKFNIIINKAINEDHGLKIFNRFAEVCQRNIRVKINCLSVVPNDELIQQQISDSSWGFESSRHSRAGYAWEQAFSLFDRQRSLGYDTGKEQVWDNLIYSNNHELKVDP